MRFRGDEGAAAYAEIADAKSQLETDLGMSFDLEVNSEQPFEGTVSLDYAGNPTDNEAFRAWLLTTANKITSTFRPFLSQLSAD